MTDESTNTTIVQSTPSLVVSGLFNDGMLRVFEVARKDRAVAWLAV